LFCSLSSHLIQGFATGTTAMITATKRTHHCSELTQAHNGIEVCLVGWIDSIRDHGGVLFLDLRDRNGLTQVLFHPTKTYSTELNILKPESVIGIRGFVEPRSPDTVNPNMPTGEIEVVAEALHVFNIAQTPPFPLDDEKARKVSEDLRLRYRYLDLRRPSMQQALQVRHRASKIVHNYLDQQGYIEVETPYLFKSSPRVPVSFSYRVASTSANFTPFPSLPSR
jgi:aspartyl-tRNA synthetase